MQKQPKKKVPDPEAVAVGERIRMIRRERGMTTEALAEAADTSPQFIFKVERGEQQMTSGKFAKLTKALGVSSDYLLFGSDGRLGRTALAAEFLGAMNPVERDMLARVVIGLQGTLEIMRPEGV